MAASYPKPAGEARTRHKPAFGRPPEGWVVLPRQHRVKAPALPGSREWSAATREWWRRIWRLPQASQWDRSGESLHPAAVVFDKLIAGADDRAVAGLAAELRQIYDRHGLSPKAMLQLRWRVADVDEEPTAAVAESASSSDVSSRRRRLLREVS